MPAALVLRNGRLLQSRSNGRCCRSNGLANVGRREDGIGKGRNAGRYHDATTCRKLARPFQHATAIGRCDEGSLDKLQHDVGEQHVFVENVPKIGPVLFVAQRVRHPPNFFRIQAATPAGLSAIAMPARAIRTACTIS